MKEAPPGFALDRLRALLVESWDIRAPELEYLPVGFGAHHWRAIDASKGAYFLALHDLGPDSDSGFDALTRAMHAAHWLRTAGELEFVVAPKRAHRVGPGVGRGAVRAACSRSTASSVRPHAQSARAVRRLADEAAAARSEWVKTHGDPYGPNLVETDDGRTMLVDWDSALLAPRERDFWEVPSNGAALRTYVDMTGVSPEATRLRLYRAWYHLAETGIYVRQFRLPHTGDLNDAEARSNFLHFMPSDTSRSDVPTRRRYRRAEVRWT